MGTDGRGRRGLTTFAVAATALAVHAVVTGRHGWYWVDDFQFLGARRHVLDRGDLGGFLFLPHNQHWSTVPVLLQLAIVSTVGLGSYVAPLVVLVATALATALLLRSVLVRVGAPGWAANLAPLLVLVLGSGGDVLVWGFTANVSLAATVVLGQFLIMDRAHPSARQQGGAAVLGVISVMISGLGAIGVAAVGGWLLVRRRWRAAAIATGPAAVAYTWWYLSYGRRALPLPAGYHFVEHQVGFGIGTVAAFAGNMLWSGAGAFLPWSIGREISAVAVACAVVHVARTCRRRPERALAIALAGTAVLTAILTALTRARYGAPIAGQPRFVHTIVVLLLPAVTLAVTDVAALARPLIGDRAGSAVGVGLLAASMIGNALALDSLRASTQAAMRVTRAEVSVLAGFPDLDLVPGDSVVEPLRTADLTIAQLRRLVQLGQLAPRTAWYLSERLDVQARYFTWSEAAGVLDRPARIQSYLFGQLDETSPGCWTATVDHALSDHLLLQLEPTGTTFETFTVHDALGTLRLTTIGGELESRPRDITLGPGHDVPMRVVRGGIQLRLQLGEGAVVCGLGDGR